MTDLSASVAGRDAKISGPLVFLVSSWWSEEHNVFLQRRFPSLD